MTIKEIRSAMGLTQRAFAAKYGISVRTVESWEEGKRNCSAIIKNFLEREAKERMQKVINQNGVEIWYNAAVDFMDDDLREELNYKLAPCTDQEFFTAYEKAHEEKFGEEWVWELSKANPTY